MRLTSSDMDAVKFDVVIYCDARALWGPAKSSWTVEAAPTSLFWNARNSCSSSSSAASHKTLRELDVVACALWCSAIVCLQAIPRAVDGKPGALWLIGR